MDYGIFETKGEEKVNSELMTTQHVSRRNFSAFAAAAVGGLVAGGAPTFGKEDGPEIFVDPALLMSGDTNVCRGLNACKGHGKGDHDCAGQAACATAETHSCAGANDCKGQGGCGGYPGQNTCNSKGHCAVPLKEDAWKLARKQFEHLMKDADKNYGDPPKN